MRDIEASGAKVIEEYSAAVANRDLAAFMRLYDPSARIFDAWGVWSYDTLARWHVAIEGWFATHPDDHFTATFDDVRVLSHPPFASVTAIVTYAVASAQGEELNSMQNRLTWILDTNGPAPRIVHEHTSAPIDFEDQKAILKRTS